jgi:hypothetical protein
VAAGVRAGFAVVTVNDQQGAGVDLPDVDEWLERAELEPGGSFNALADLDLVDPDCWEPALQLIAADRSARACLLPSPGGLSYSGWWLSRHARIGGRPPEEWRLPAAADLAGLYDPVPMALDPLIARAIGVRTGLTQAASDDPVGLLERLADPSRTVSPARVTALTAAVVAALADDEDVDLPLGVRTLSGDVVDAADACVLDEPWLAQILPARRLVPGGADAALVARVLDLPAASAQMRVSVLGDGDESVVGTRQAVARGSGQARADGGESVNWEPILRRLDRAAAAVGLRREDFDVTVSPTLRVAINDHDPVPVRWWGAHNRYWTDGSAAAAGRVVAWASGRWSERHRIIAAALDDAVALAEDGLGAIERA